MGWAYGINREGRRVGYGVRATCDQRGCHARIDRGLAYVCGGMHDGDEHGCGRYFCGNHLTYAVQLDTGEDYERAIWSRQVCQACCDRIEAELVERRGERIVVGDTAMYLEIAPVGWHSEVLMMPLRCFRGWSFVDGSGARCVGCRAVVQLGNANRLENLRLSQGAICKECAWLL
jgi:hypothetical protein